MDEKTLDVSDIKGAREAIPDIKVVGDGDMFALLCKASSASQGWMKSTKAMVVVGGCVVQVTTQQKNEDGTYPVAEALTYVPGVTIATNPDGGGLLVPHAPALARTSSGHSGAGLGTLEGFKDFLSYHAPAGTDPQRYSAINSAFQALADAIWPHIPDGPGKTVAERQIGLARMMCNSAIANKGI